MDVSVDPGSNWRKTLAAGVISIVVIVVGQTLVSKISAREPRLTYAAPESLPFNGEGKSVGIYQLEIANEGDSAAEGLTGSVRVPMAVIDNHRVTGPGALPVDIKVEGDVVHLSAPSLNPTETIHLSVLASSSTTLPGNPDVSVRANGVTGVRRLPGTSRMMPISFFPTLLIATLAVALMLLLQFTFRSQKIGSLAHKSPSVLPDADSGWRKVANVFWLGHDLLWTSNAVLGATRERISHGLRQSRHHASQIGLTDTDAYREMDALYTRVGGLSDVQLSQQQRTDLSVGVNGLIGKFGNLARAQQPDFQPSPR
jgi:hypothetical protein